MSDFNYRRRGDFRGLQEQRSGDRNPAPVNLYQDSCNLKLSSVPRQYRDKIEDLTSKIGYQINYFSFSDKPSNRVELTCNLCRDTLRISKVDKHILNPKHLRNLTKQCENATSSASEAFQPELPVNPAMPFSSTSGRQTDWNKNSSSPRTSFSNDRNNKVRRGFKRESRIISTVPPKIARNSMWLDGAEFDVWSLSDSTMCQNSTSMSFFDYSDIEKEIIEKLRNDSSLQYFDFLYAVKKDKSFFRCNLCGIHVKPDSILSHVQTEHHLRNVTLNSKIENFLSLAKSTKNILRKLFLTIGEDFINNFLLLPDSGSEKPEFKCRHCKVTLFSEFVVDHLQSNEHQKSVNQKVTENINRASVSGGIRSSPAASDLHKRSPNMNFKSVRDSIENVSRETLAKTALSSAESCKSNTLVFETTKDERFFRSNNFNSYEYEREVEIEYKSNNVQLVSCLICNKDVSSKDLQNHVNSKVHVTRLGIEPSPYDYYRDDFSCDYFREIVKIFTDFTHYKRSCFHIFYELTQKNLHFYCKFCNLISSAESLELHVSSIHSNDLSGEQKNLIFNIGKNSEVKYLSCATGVISQSSKKFQCEPCNDHVYFKDIANHVNSRRHSESLETFNNCLKFNSFIAYKDRLVETLVPLKQKRTSDFELFSEINSTKLFIYCKPCAFLLRPECLRQHVDVEISSVHEHNSMMKLDRDYNAV